MLFVIVSSFGNGNEYFRGVKIKLKLNGLLDKILCLKIIIIFIN